MDSIQSWYNTLKGGKSKSFLLRLLLISVNSKGCIDMYDPYNLSSALNVGLALIVAGFTLLGIVLPFVAKKWEVSTSIFAQRASFVLVIGGLILVFLHFLHLMELIPLHILENF